MRAYYYHINGVEENAIITRRVLCTILAARTLKTFWRDKATASRVGELHCHSGGKFVKTR